MRKTAFLLTFIALFLALGQTNLSAQAYTYIRYDENTMDRLDHQFIDANNSALYTSYRLTKNAGERIFLDIGIESPRIHKKEPPSMVSWQKAKIDQDFITGINTGRRKVYICKKLDSGWAVQIIGSGIYLSNFDNVMTFVSSNYDFKADFNQTLGNNLSINTRELANPANVFYVGELPACDKTAKTFKVFPSETRRYETTVTILPELGLIRENAEVCPTYELVGVNGKDVCTFINGGERPAPAMAQAAEPSPEPTPVSYGEVRYTNPTVPEQVPESYNNHAVTYTTEVTPTTTAYVPVEVPVDNGDVYVRSKTVVENNNITKSDNFDYSTPTDVPVQYTERSVKKDKPVAKVECNYSVSEGEHLILSGENLYSIARRYGVTVASLRAWNGLADDKLQPCTALKIVAPAEEAVTITSKSITDVPTEYKNTAVKVTAKKVEKPVEKKIIECQVEFSEGEHVVLQGENLYAIARKYKVTEEQLKVWNKLPNDIIKPCQKLVVAAPTVTVTPKSAETPKEYRVIAKPKTTVTAKGVTKTSAALVKEGSGLHVVQKGETIIGLAKQFLMTEAEFRKINFMTVDESLSIGQVVRTKDCACTITEEDNTLSLQPVPVANDVPKGYNYVGSKSLTAKGSTRKYHVVQTTETLYAIAKKYGKSVDELRKLNSFSGSEVIVPNQTIVLE